MKIDIFQEYISKYFFFLVVLTISHHEETPEINSGASSRSLVMKMLIYIKGKLAHLVAYAVCITSFDEISIQKKYVRNVSIFENISKNILFIFYTSLIISLFLFIFSHGVPADTCLTPVFLRFPDYFQK